MRPFVSSMLAVIAGGVDSIIRRVRKRLTDILAADVYLGKHIDRLPAGSLVFFPYRETVLNCGIAALVSYKERKAGHLQKPSVFLDELVSQLEDLNFDSCKAAGDAGIADRYLGGDGRIDTLWNAVQELKTEDRFLALIV